MEISHDIQHYDYNIINQNNYDTYTISKIIIFIYLFIYFNWHHANLNFVFNNLLLSIYSFLRISFVFNNVIIVIKLNPRFVQSNDL